MSIGQEQFEGEVLFSLMKDSVNILLRTQLRPRGLSTVESVGSDWTDRLALEYLPEFARDLPLAGASVVPPSSGDDVEF